jgi:hypothetical protein
MQSYVAPERVAGDAYPMWIDGILLREPTDRILRFSQRFLPVLDQTKRIRSGFVDQRVVARAMQREIYGQTRDAPNSERSAHRIGEPFFRRAESVQQENGRCASIAIGLEKNGGDVRTRQLDRQRSAAHFCRH